MLNFNVNCFLRVGITRDTCFYVNKLLYKYTYILYHYDLQHVRIQWITNQLCLNIFTRYFGQFFNNDYNRVWVSELIFKKLPTINTQRI